MTQEEKAKAYDEAIETCKRVFNFDNLSYTHCEIKERLEQIFPELSEDERIRKALVKTFEKKLERGFEWIEFGIPNRSVLDWLEKKKEQKPSISCGHENDIEWSEEDEEALDMCIDAIPKAWKTKSRKLLTDWLKEHLRPQPHWKPTKEQMEAFECAMRLYKDTHFAFLHERITSLYEQLKKLM